jgi:L-xylulokinase
MNPAETSSSSTDACPARSFFLGVDNGGTVSKAAVFDGRGRELATGARRVNILSPRPGWSERSMEEHWADTAAAIREAIEKSGVAPGQIRGVACTGHGNGVYLLDKEGAPLRNAINSSDSRAAHYVARWRETGVGARVLPKTAQTLWAAQPAPLLAWLRDNEPDVLRRAGTVLMAKDYTRHCLTGDRLAEITDMSGTGLMNVVGRRYDNSILEAHGIPEVAPLLPPLIGTADVAGTVTAEAAARTGLAAGTPVAGGMFDIDACALASGMLDSGEFSIVAGTWGNNQYIAREPLVDPDLFMTSCYSIPGWYLMLEGSPTSAGNLEWFLDSFFAVERETWGAQFYGRIAELAASAPAGSGGVLFLPFLYGSNAGNVRGGFHGLDSTHSRAMLLRAVFEGVTFAHFQHIQRLLKFRDYPAVIRLAGGAAKNPFWCQMFADCTGVPVEVPAGSELGALGAAIAAAVATGAYPDFPAAVRAMTSIERTYHPDPAKTIVYRERYAAYQDLISRLKA